MTEDTAWLIEHPHDPRYGRESWYSGKDGFTIDSLQAVRFARKEDAVREIDRFPASLAKNLVAAHHSWIPARVCPHGQLRRQCEICEAKEEAAHWRNKAENAFEPIRKIADALREFGYEPTGEDQWVALVHRALTELDQRRRQRASDPNLLVELLAIPDDATEDTEWLILHARLTKFLFATGERGLKNLLGTVTMLRERLLEIGNEVLSKQVHEPRDGYLSPVLPSDHVDCR